MNKLQKYLHDILGIHMELQKVHQTNIQKLPLYLRETYLCRSAILLNHNVILLKQKNRQHFTVEQYRKHTEIFEKTMSRPVILVLDNVESYNRMRMIKKQIAFIVPGQQMFIPQLLIDLKEFRNSTQKTTDKLQPATQCLLLFHLLKETMEQMDFKTIAQKLDYSATTISRSARELKEHNLCKIHGTKNKHLVFYRDKKTLWDNALPYLGNPVNRKVYAPVLHFLEMGFKTSYHALSFYTDIAETGKPSFAISKAQYRQLKQVAKLSETDMGESTSTLEIWEYPPDILAKDQYVDPLSLFLIFREMEDERIEKAIERMVEDLW